MTKFITINQTQHDVNDEQLDMPLLWFIRETLHLKGTKYGCGMGQCGACTVHIDGKALRSCTVNVGQVYQNHITTIEGITTEKESLHPVQEAWKELDVPQCGYCQPGQIMSAIALLKEYPSPDENTIEQEMTNICRCGTYTRIRKAIQLASKKSISTRIVEG